VSIPAGVFFSLDEWPGASVSRYTCTCWDAPRSDCCYCGAEVYWEQRAANDRKAAIVTQHSYDMCCWAFGVEAFA
jgi:hypothetical protein